MEPRDKFEHTQIEEDEPENKKKRYGIWFPFLIVGLGVPLVLYMLGYFENGSNETQTPTLKVIGKELREQELSKIKEQTATGANASSARSESIADPESSGANTSRNAASEQKDKESSDSTSADNLSKESSKSDEDHSGNVPNIPDEAIDQGPGNVFKIRFGGDETTAGANSPNRGATRDLSLDSKTGKPRQNAAKGKLSTSAASTTKTKQGSLQDEKGKVQHFGTAEKGRQSQPADGTNARSGGSVPPPNVESVQGSRASGSAVNLTNIFSGSSPNSGSQGTQAGDPVGKESSGGSGANEALPSVPGKDANPAGREPAALGKQPPQPDGTFRECMREVEESEWYKKLKGKDQQNVLLQAQADCTIQQVWSTK